MNFFDKSVLSVVIPTLGRQDLLRAVRSLAETGMANKLDIVVVGKINNPSMSSEINKLSSRFARLLILSVSFETGDSSKKKNTGFDAALSEIVAFLDDDVVVARDWPEKTLASFNSSKTGLMSGPGLIPFDVPLMARLAGVTLASKASGYVSQRYVAGNQEPGPVKWSRLIGCNMAYRANVLKAVGGFDPKFWPGEEMLAAFKATRLGHELVFNPCARVYHYPRATFLSFCKQIFGYGATRIRLYRAGVELELATIVPGLWVLSLIILGLGSFFSIFLSCLLALNLGLYLLMCVFITFDKVYETRKLSDAFMFFLIPLMHFCYGVAEWVEFIRPNKDLSMDSA